MDIDEQEDLPLVHEIDNPEAAGPESLMQQLRARRDELANTKQTFIPVVGFEELGLQAEHRLMERIEVTGIGRRVMAETKDRGERNMRIMLDQIINSTTGFYIQPEGVEQPERLMHDNGGGQLLTWDQLAQYLGWEPNGSARSALYYVFGDNEFAIGQYGIALNRWMSNTGLKVDDEFLGEGM